MGPRTYDDDALVAAVTESRSWREVLRRLGLAATSASAIRSVRHHAERLGLEHSHFTGQRRWSDTELAAAVASASSWGQVAEALGLSGGSSETTLKGHAARLGIDAEHLRRRQPTPPVGSPLTMLPDPAQLPRAGSLLAAAWFTLCGYEVSWPLEPCRYDLVVRSGRQLLRIQVKTARVRNSDSWVVWLSNTRRTRVTYDPDEIDYFYVVNGDLDHYLIPLSSVGGLHAIRLAAYEAFKLPRQPSTRF